MAFAGGLFVAVVLAYQLRLIYFTRVQGNQAASSIKVGDNRDKVGTTEQPAHLQTPQRASGNQQSSRTSFSQPHSTLTATAETGNATAEYQMGLRYAAGVGVPRDESASAEWFKKAANQGHVGAQRALSDLYLNGRGVPRDYVRAYTWASIALSRDNNNNHNKELKSMASLMTPAQISDAHTRIAVWSKQRGGVQP